MAKTLTKAGNKAVLRAAAMIIVARKLKKKALKMIVKKAIKRAVKRRKKRR